MTVTLVGNMISRQMAFFIYSLSSISWYISFLHFKSFKIQFHEVPNDIMHCSVKDLQNTYLLAKNDTFKYVNIVFFS